MLGDPELDDWLKPELADAFNLEGVVVGFLVLFDDRRADEEVEADLAVVTLDGWVLLLFEALILEAFAGAGFVAVDVVLAVDVGILSN